MTTCKCNLRATTLIFQLQWQLQQISATSKQQPLFNHDNLRTYPTYHINHLSINISCKQSQCFQMLTAKESKFNTGNIIILFKQCMLKLFFQKCAKQYQTYNIYHSTTLNEYLITRNVQHHITTSHEYKNLTNILFHITSSNEYYNETAYNITFQPPMKISV